MEFKDRQDASSEGRQRIMKKVNAFIASDEMTREVLGEMGSLFVAPGWKVGDLVQTSIDGGHIKWGNDDILRFPA